MKTEMSEGQVKELEQLIREVLNLESEIDVATLSTNDCPAWDSLRHVELVLKIQSLFKIKVSGAEMAGLRSVSDIKQLINAHLRASN